jgi:LytS/YehU family sensor histidine kinase
MLLVAFRLQIGYAPTELFLRLGVLPAFLFVWSASTTTVVAIALTAMSRSRAAAEAWHETELRTAGLERELAEAELQLLQAQSEPHFLFNALANVRRLLRTDPPAARGLLTDLLRYIQESLPALRSESSTLGREAELVRAFLAVHQVRMGPRLQSDVDVPPALSDRTVPSMVLLTLVENALKHGLQPAVDGGSVRVSAHARDGCLMLTVADTGRGMVNSSGQGTGLANLRARLRSRYGTAASLTLTVNEPRGVVATVSLPCLP